jgi:hypothetical protein
MTDAGYYYATETTAGQNLHDRGRTRGFRLGAKMQ